MIRIYGVRENATAIWKRLYKEYGQVLERTLNFMLFAKSILDEIVVLPPPALETRSAIIYRCTTEDRQRILNIIPQMVCRTKRDANNRFEKYKARIVVKGYVQQNFCTKKRNYAMKFIANFARCKTKGRVY